VTPKVERCPHCQSTELFEVASVAPHHARLGCSACKRHIRFLPAPWTRERAESFTMPFGKHRGQRLGNLAKTAVGRSYLAWLSENVDGNAQTAAALLLEAAG
jgi:hypothetical protein